MLPGQSYSTNFSNTPLSNSISLLYFFLISVVRGIGRFDVFVYSVTGSLFRIIILRELFFSIFIEKKEGASPKVYFWGHPLPIMDFFTFLNVYL